MDSPRGTETQATAEAAVRISMLELQNERVEVLNSSDAAVDLSGWTLKSLTGSQQFAFPEEFSLAQGEVVNVVSGPGWEDKEFSSLPGEEQERQLVWGKRPCESLRTELSPIGSRSCHSMLCCGLTYVSDAMSFPLCNDCRWNDKGDSVALVDPSGTQVWLQAATPGHRVWRHFENS